MNVLIIGARSHIGRSVARYLLGCAEVNLFLGSRSDSGVEDLRTVFPGALVLKIDANCVNSLRGAVGGMHRVVVISSDFANETVVTRNLIEALYGVVTLEQVIRVTGQWPPVAAAAPKSMQEVNLTAPQLLAAWRLLRESGLPVTLVDLAADDSKNFHRFTGEGTCSIAEMIAGLLQQESGSQIGREYSL
ncbi:hypothetical protein HBA55_00515 [Pseudomaricurvus alkylphenolicus]|uniref:hypothetical protein n=1 Tax=Pseudomaricurvus alkylphenolicus TaxID=1306991 RepID=UPI00141E6480|nr:hypothetical protein [Pseudomaricurvus alkylphenolicus]NIB38042.1 hypothetical protein [Pseudomaricurvus alkylphenolicus]